MLRASANAARACVLVGSLATLVLVRTPIPVPLLVVVVGGSLGALYLVERRNRAFRLWVVYVLGFTLFAHLRTLADETGLPVQVGYVIDAEQAVFGAVPTVWLQEHLFQPGAVNALDVLAVATHLSYFLVPHALAIALWKIGHPRFQRYVADVLATAYAGLAVSFLVPTAPPWLAGQWHDLPFVHRIVHDVIAGFDPELYRQGYEIAGTNPVAAMPSLHMAITAVVVVTAWRLGRVAGASATVYAAAMAFALVYTGEHYALDVLAGTATALIAVAGVGLVVRVAAATRAPSREGCGQPTPSADPPLEACPPLSRRSGTKPRRASAPV